MEDTGMKERKKLSAETIAMNTLARAYCRRLRKEQKNGKRDDTKKAGTTFHQGRKKATAQEKTPSKDA
jgi:hypothetical protein